jgi:hypothetical protein
MINTSLLNVRDVLLIAAVTVLLHVLLKPVFTQLGAKVDNDPAT